MAKMKVKAITLGDALAGLDRLGWTVSRERNTERQLFRPPGGEDLFLANDRHPAGLLLPEPALVNLARTRFHEAIREQDLADEQRRKQALAEALKSTKPLMFDHIMCGPRGMYTVDVFMTPARAWLLLEEGEKHPVLKYRHATPQEVQWWRNTYLDGQWRETGMSIDVTGDGDTTPLFPLNGQHRLRGLVLSGVEGEWMRVTFGVPEDAYSVYDVGKKRTLKDISDTGGTEVSTNGSSALKLMWTYGQMQAGALESSSWKKWPGIRMSPTVYGEFSRAHEAGVNAFEARAWRIYHATGGRLGGLLPAATIAFQHIALTAWPQGADKLEEFLKGVETGEMLPGDDARKTVRESRIEGRNKRERQLIVLLRCWSAYATDRRLGRVSIAADQVMPAAYQP